MSTDIVQAHYSEMEGIAGRFAGAGERVQEVARGVQGRADVLRRGGWEGKGQAAFLAEMDALVLPSLGRLAAALAEAGDTTAQMREAIRTAEEAAARLFAANGVAGSSNGPASAPGADVDDGLDVLALMSSLGVVAGPAFVKLLEFTGFFSKYRTTIKPLLLSVGRILNTVMGRRGYVGAMNKLYQSLFPKQLPFHGAVAKLLRSKGFGVALGVADGFFGAVDDWEARKYNGDLNAIIGVNSLDAGMQVAIGLTGVGEAILIVNAANQGIGTLESGAMAWYADKMAANDRMREILKNDADSMQAAYKKMDVTNITKELAEGIWFGYGELLTPHRNLSQASWSAFTEISRDPSLETMGRVANSLGQTGWNNLPGLFTSSVGLLAPGNGWMYTNAGRQNVGDALKATINVADGLLDSTMIRSSAVNTRWLNSVVRDVEHLPVSAGMKRQISNAAQETARGIDAWRTWTTGLIDFKTGDPAL